MTYCTNADVYLETGTALGTITSTDVDNMIVKSDKEIVAKLRKAGITSLPATDDDLQTASVQLTIAKIKRRQSQELSRPGSLNLGDISFSAQPETEAVACDVKAQDAINSYITTVRRTTGIRIRRTC